MSRKTVYTEEQTKLLKKTQGIRLEMLHELTADGIDDDPDSVNAVTKLINDIDKQVQTTVTLELRKQTVDTGTEAKALVLELLKTVSNPPAAIDTVIIPEPNFLLEGTVAGHMDIDPEPLNPKDFIGDN